MWSFYHDKSHQIWLWWAIDHATNTPLAFTFGTREHKNLDDLLHCCSHFPSGGFIPTTTLLTINEFLPNNIPQGKGTHRKSREIT